MCIFADHRQTWRCHIFCRSCILRSLRQANTGGGATVQSSKQRNFRHGQACKGRDLIWHGPCMPTAFMGGMLTQWLLIQNRTSAGADIPEYLVGVACSLHFSIQYLLRHRAPLGIVRVRPKTSSRSRAEHAVSRGWPCRQLQIFAFTSLFAEPLSVFALASLDLDLACTD